MQFIFISKYFVDKKGFSNFYNEEWFDSNQSIESRPYLMRYQTNEKKVVMSCCVHTSRDATVAHFGLMLNDAGCVD